MALDLSDSVELDRRKSHPGTADRPLIAAGQDVHHVELGFRRPV